MVYGVYTIVVYVVKEAIVRYKCILTSSFPLRTANCTPRWYHWTLVPQVTSLTAFKCRSTLRDSVASNSI